MRARLIVLLAGVWLLMPAQTSADALKLTAVINLGRLAAFDPSSGALVKDFPRTDADSLVYAVAADGAGGFYIGGRVARIGGVGCRNLAHVLATRRVDRAWCPAPNESVRALLVANGKLFVAGGSFTRIAGAKRQGVEAAFSRKDGATVGVFDTKLGGGYVWHLAHDPYRNRLLVTGDLDLSSPFRVMVAFRTRRRSAKTSASCRSRDRNHHGDSAFGSVIGRAGRSLPAWELLPRRLGGKERHRGKLRSIPPPAKRSTRLRSPAANSTPPASKERPSSRPASLAPVGMSSPRSCATADDGSGRRQWETSSCIPRWLQTKNESSPSPNQRTTRRESTMCMSSVSLERPAAAAVSSAPLTCGQTVKRCGSAQSCR